ncbi:MOXD1 homolog 2-like [Calliphora vicina]|uniref:MOXD1 homolog 2-like n=1 Tax=Calliphora vicina TaxID=7373 RepID=UPI00325BD8A4
MKMAPSKCHRSLSLSSLIICFCKSSLIICIALLTILLTGAGLTNGAVLSSSSSSSSSFNNMEYDTMNWNHVVDLNEDFRLLWTIINQDITFEIQVRTLGYVGFGFSENGNQAGADMAVGWVDGGHTFFQDRYVDQTGSAEPQIDPSQDYILMKGYENGTHTVLRFRRKLDTCDNKHDITINNNTMRVMYMYYDEDPPRGSVLPAALPNPEEAWRPYRSLLLLQKSPFDLPDSERSARVLELRNQEVELPYGDDSQFWCKMFKLDKLERKHHIIKYEPIFDSSWSYHYLQQMTLYECQGNSVEMEQLSRGSGQMCLGVKSFQLGCNDIVASWTRGSEGFVFPSEAGFPLESKRNKYYVMETHYNNLNAEFEPYQARRMTDSSGLKIVFTPDLRPHDAGVLSIGMDPNWRHIIPPGQERVISQGQCMEDCTGSAFPPQGIHIFAVMMRTHQIGKEAKLRQIRQSEELFPIAHDSNVDSSYQEFRRLSHPVHSLPGDRLVAECIYDSSSRKAITLGGLTMKEESCTVLTLYYPRQKSLTTCHSLPSLPTVLHSLGIEQLAMNSNPVVIASPPELAGMTLETRLLSYDWENQFDKFQEATMHGTFKPICSGAHNQILPISEHLIGHNKNISKMYKEPRRCKPKRLFVTETIPQLELPVLRDFENNHISEASVRSSRSSFIETLALSGSESSSCRQHVTWHSIHLACLLSLTILWFAR